MRAGRNVCGACAELGSRGTTWGFATVHSNRRIPGVCLEDGLELGPTAVGLEV